jgi:hypothetical protein
MYEHHRSEWARTARLLGRAEALAETLACAQLTATGEEQCEQELRETFAELLQQGQLELSIRRVLEAAA